MKYKILYVNKTKKSKEIYLKELLFECIGACNCKLLDAVAGAFRYRGQESDVPFQYKSKERFQQTSTEKSRDFKRKEKRK